MVNKLVASIFFICLLTLIGCDKETDFQVQDLAGDWEVTDVAKYRQGEPVIFSPGRSYFILGSYAQGVSVSGNDFFHRYGLDPGPLQTVSTSSGTIKVLNDRLVEFTYPSAISDGTESELADVVEVTNDLLWLKFHADDTTELILEYKFSKN